MEPLAIIILAAGKGTRLGGNHSKALLQTSQGPLLELCLKTALSLSPEKVIVVTGHCRQEVEALARSVSPQVTFAFQEQQRGTGDAVRAALPALEAFSGDVLILYADMPLVRASSLQALRELHQREKATISLITVQTTLFHDYGRIVRDEHGQITRIIEAKDCSPQQLLGIERNPAYYMVDSAFLAPAITSIRPHNAQKEFYLTDLVEIAAREGQNRSTLVAADPLEFQGVNTWQDLITVERILRDRLVQSLLEQDVTVRDPASLIISPKVRLGRGCVIGPFVHLEGATIIGDGVTIEGAVCLTDCVVEQGAVIKWGTRATGASIGPHAAVGPFAHLRADTKLGSHAKIGNFVETKNAVLGEGAKASHLTYLGDCTVGTDANIGAGTITCNYDGVKKSRTEIGDSVFIGSNSALVAPVSIGKGAFIGAGSVITKDVEAGSLAVARAQQIEKKGWAIRKKKK